MKIHWATLVLVGFVLSGTGCATLPYKYGQKIECPETYKLPPGEAQVFRGKPVPGLDHTDWIWPGSLLGKLVLWNWRVDRHRISTNTEAVLAHYLAQNDLQNVKVRINDYSPREEWRRTIHNTAIGGGWKYSIGVLAWLGYAIFPGRIFGGDNYNPFSNTINLYSDIPMVAVHEGGHAKDTAQRTHKGTYSASYIIPFVPLYHEAVATSDALSWAREDQPLELQKQGYQILYPAYGTYVGSPFGEFWGGPVTQFGAIIGAIPGHIIGRTKAARLPDPASTQAPAKQETPPAPPPAQTNAPPPQSAPEIQPVMPSGG